VAGLEITTSYLPMAEVAGDFYDFLDQCDGRLGVLVADVSGHGVPAALIASMVKIAFAAQADHASDPARVIGGMNHALCGKFEFAYVTATYAFLDPTSRRLEYASAGHPPIMNSLSPIEQNRLLAAMKTIEETLGAEPKDEKFSYLLRPPQAGDLGWVVQCNGALYAQAYGWDETYEALVAQIVADFVKNYDPKKERCWIAEKDGENVGSVFLVKDSDRVAKLRLLIVDPKARGLGIGKRLADECTSFARQAGYKKITLWTNSVLLAARGIYQKAGYKLVKAENHHSFGQDLVGETWELEL
jgi:GNAT superfamily N-acetyltransferase